MAIGDREVDADGYGTEEVLCGQCGGLSPDCDWCDGEGTMLLMVAPEGEIEAAVENVLDQIKALERPHLRRGRRVW